MRGQHPRAWAASPCVGTIPVRGHYPRVWKGVPGAGEELCSCRPVVMVLAGVGKR